MKADDINRLEREIRVVKGQIKKLIERLKGLEDRLKNMGRQMDLPQQGGN